ncbi:odorant receptor 131-2-like [Aplochiton taeniatus]
MQSNVTVEPYVGLVEDGFYCLMNLSSCLMFLYVNGVMLFTLRSKPVFKETPRYILLYNLLLGDTCQGTGVAIAVVWSITSANTLFRYIMLFLLDSTPMNQILPDYCTKESVFPRKILAAYEEVYTCIVFVSVGVIIIFSYFGVMVAARSASSDKASTSKARKTVLLHLIQLCLSLSTRQNY